MSRSPILSQVQRMKKFSQGGKLPSKSMLAIMSEEKIRDLDKVTFSSDTLRKYFPKSYTPKRMEEAIIKLLEQWQCKGAAAILEHFLPVITILRFIVIHIMNWAHAALPLWKCRRNFKKITISTVEDDEGMSRKGGSF